MDATLLILVIDFVNNSIYGRHEQQSVGLWTGEAHDQ